VRTIAATKQGSTEVADAAIQIGWKMADPDKANPGTASFQETQPRSHEKPSLRPSLLGMSMTRLDSTRLDV
jgi:hypothetical protein